MGFVKMDKNIKKSLNHFAKQTGLGIRIQSYWILASLVRVLPALALSVQIFLRKRFDSPFT